MGKFEPATDDTERTKLYPTPFAKMLSSLHANEESEVQAAVGHDMILFKLELAEKSLKPKFRPATVTDCPTDSGKLNRELPDTTPLSNVNAVTRVPATVPTVTVALSEREEGGPHKHTSEVPEDHALVVHATDTTAEAVKSSAPKLRPLTETDVAPVLG